MTGIFTAGEAFQIEAKKILKGIQKAYEQVQNVQTSQHREIRIGHSVKLDFNFMNDLLSAYTEHYPDHYLHFERMKKSELPSALSNKSIDCFIIINPQKNEFKGIRNVRLAESEMYAVVHKKHPLAAKEKITFDDLIPYDVYMSSVLDNSLYEDFESLIGTRLHVLDKTDRNDLMVSMMKNCVILYPCPVSHNICIPFEYPPLPVYFYYREDDPVLADVYRLIQKTIKNVNNVIM